MCFALGGATYGTYSQEERRYLLYEPVEFFCGAMIIRLLPFSITAVLALLSGLIIPQRTNAAEPTIEIYILGHNGHPKEVYPLPECAGDCDDDDDCGEGLMCYERAASEAVRGCLGGEDHEARTDFCIRRSAATTTIAPPNAHYWSLAPTTFVPTTARPTSTPTTDRPTTTTTALSPTHAYNNDTAPQQPLIVTITTVATYDAATVTTSVASAIDYQLVDSSSSSSTAADAAATTETLVPTSTNSPTFPPTGSPTSSAPTTGTPTNKSTTRIPAVFVPIIIADNDEDGDWGNVFDMKVIPIHAIMLNDGQILAYGTDNKGHQGAERYYEIWDTRNNKHTVSSNHGLYRQSTKVDIFCSTVSMDVTTGNILIMGGDDGDNNGVKDAFEFNSRTHEIRKHPRGDMNYARWYGSSVNLPDGHIFVIGGESGKRKVQSPIPEIWTPGDGFRPLWGAEVDAIGTSRAKFYTKAWYYPHTYVNSNGDVIVVIGKGRETDVYRIGVDGNGSIRKIGTKPFDSHMLGPSIMYDIDQVLFLDNSGYLWNADISNSNLPRFSRRASIGKPRTNGAMAILPDGRVAISGGCSELDKQGEDLKSANYHIQIWDPRTNKVYDGPKQKEARLYHSTSLILPDSTVVSMGGGAPGPVRNRNGQIYTPGYLVDPETGSPATRPLIVSCPKNARAGTIIYIEVDNGTVDDIQRVTATKSGSMTHARNNDARFVELAFRATPGTLAVAVSLPNKNIMIPGLWNINLIDMDGVPSMASLIGINMVDL